MSIQWCRQIKNEGVIRDFRCTCLKTRNAERNAGCAVFTRTTINQGIHQLQSAQGFAGCGLGCRADLYMTFAALPQPQQAPLPDGQVQPTGTVAEEYRGKTGDSPLPLPQTLEF